ncbi:FidL-like protein [Serratia fonticola]|uniref:FidL-like protein n=1 Tax=Serratia fonticola TaxID=47917 RepID=A0AAJ1Y7N9_SERFO|nr:FidL-like protein [Serratia fonticola]ATM76791.1 hypothetical protein CRN79_13495 [Serratia fonticola]MDQ9125475.1 FidL-like protein [Serratia fonticola]
MKKIIISLLFIVALCGSFYHKNYSSKPFRCDAHLIALVEQDSNHVELNLHDNLILTLPTEGLVSMTGTIKQNDKDYLVSRTLFFTIKKSGLKNNYKVEISREEIDKRDELPEDLWLKYVFPKSTGVEFYSEVRELNKNAILLQSLSNPLLVCVRTEN